MKSAEDLKRMIQARIEQCSGMSGEVSGYKRMLKLVREIENHCKDLEDALTLAYLAGHKDGREDGK